MFPSDRTRPRGGARFWSWPAGLLVACAAIVVATPGCSSEDDAPTAGAFAGYIADKFCTSVAICCGQRNIAYDGASCDAQIRDIYQTTVDVVKRGHSTYNQEGAIACANAITDRVSQCSPTGEDKAPPTQQDGWIDTVTRACWNVVQGQLKPGEQCTDALECAVDGPEWVALCIPDPLRGGGARVCVRAKAHLGLGSGCTLNPKTYEATACEPTIGYCQGPQGATDGKCAGYSNVGGPCGQDQRCDPKTAFCANGTCQTIPRAGDDCSASNGACLPRHFCNSNRQCEAQRQTGGYCLDHIECATGSCDRTRGVCVGVPAQGLYAISPRTCGFGPNGTGAEDQGIATTSFELRSTNDGFWSNTAR